jgi:type VI secretion system (T6SS) effector Hcp
MGSRRRYAAEQQQTPRRAVIQRSEESGNGVLELQRSAGNRAVAERIEVARDPAGQDTDVRKATTVTLSGIGSFEAASFSWGTTTGRSGGSGGGGADRSSPTEIVITVSVSALGELASKLSSAAARGQKIETADIERTGTTIHLKDCYVGSFQAGSGDNPMVTFTLNFGSIEYGDKADSGKPD